MSKFKSLLAAILLGLLQPVGLNAQDITNHSMPIGKGPGVVGWGVLGPCGVGQVPVWAGGASSDPTCGFPGSAGVLGVANGGTGQSSLTLDALVVGNGTSAVQLIGPGTTGQALMGVTGSPPFFTGSPIFATSVAAPFFNASTGSSGYSLGGVIFANTNGNYTQILSPSSQVSAALLLVGNATDPEVYSRGNFVFQNLSGSGQLVISGSTTATAEITIQNGGATSGYNFILPTTPGTAGQVLTSQAGSAPMTWSSGSAVPLPTTQKFTSGTNLTYTTPVGATWIEGYLTGGGGGGGGGDSGSVGSAGGGTCWNTSGTACTTPLWEAGGGSSGTGSTAQGVIAGGAGGAVSGSQSCDIQANGANGGGNPSVGLATTIGAAGGYGASSWLGGAGSPTYDGQGSGGNANTGSGGAGGGISAVAASPGSGGGAGAFCHFIIKTPAATYVYTVGTAGVASTGGASGSNGGTGAAGLIVIIEHYGS